MNWFALLLGTRRNVATTTRRPSTARLHLESLEERQVPTVTFHGGNLLAHVETQALYLGNAWSTQSTPAQLDGFLGNVTGGAYMDALTRAGYNLGRGTATAGKVDKVQLTAGSTITDGFIQNEISADIKSGLLATPDANRLYIVYVQPDVAINLGGATSQTGFLGYHGAFYASNGATIRYAVIAYPGGKAGNASLGTSAIDQLTAVTSHELAEAVTNPDVNLSRLGWYDDQRNGEIGDITENNPNALIRLNGYLVQQVADQNDNLLLVNTGPVNPPPTSTGATTTRLTAGRVHYHSDGTASVALTITVGQVSGTTLPDGQVQLIYNGSVLATGTIKVVHGVAQVTFNVTFSSFSDTSWDYYTFGANYTGSSHFGASASHNVTVAV